MESYGDGRRPSVDINSAVITINQEGIIESVDRTCSFMLGYEPAELVGKNVSTIVPPPYKEQHDSYLTNYHAGGIPKIIGRTRVVEAQHKSGAIFPIRLSVSQVTLPGSRCYIGTIDKLESKQAIITATMEGVIVSVNQNCEEMFGYKVSELVGKNVSILMPPPQCYHHDGYMKQYHHSGVPKVIGQVRNLPAKHRMGTVFPICLQVRHVKVGAADLVRATIDKIDTEVEVVFTLDVNGIIEQTNKNFVLPMFGFTSGELVGKHISLLVPALASKLANPENLKKRKGEEEQWQVKGTRRLEVRHKDGSTFPVDFDVIKFVNAAGEPKYSGRVRRIPEVWNEDSSGSGESGSSSLAQGSFTPAPPTPLTDKTPSAEFVGDYELGMRVGHGSYAEVRLVTHRYSKNRYAMKILQKALIDAEQLERIKREIEILRNLTHPHIVRLFDVIETADHINIVMEYVSGGELQTYITKRKRLDEAEAREIFAQIAEAVAYCHSLNIIHRDLKHKNILLDQHREVKLIDFGLSNFTADEGQLRSTFCGTPAYAAPEMILARKYVGPEVDVWSLGVVLFAMVTGRFPFETVADIVEGRLTMPEHVSPGKKKFLDFG